MEFDFVKVADTGFEAALDIEYEPFLYKLHIKQYDGNTYTITDPYAFIPVLSEYDRYLISVGTHYELYRKLGANIVEHQDVIGIQFAVWARMQGMSLSLVILILGTGAVTLCECWALLEFGIHSSS